MRCSSSSSSSSRVLSHGRHHVAWQPTLPCQAVCNRIQARAADSAGAHAAAVPFARHNPASAEESALPPGKCWLAGVGPGSWDHVTVSSQSHVAAGSVKCSSRLLELTAEGLQAVATSRAFLACHDGMQNRERGRSWIEAHVVCFFAAGEGGEADSRGRGAGV